MFGFKLSPLPADKDLFSFLLIRRQLEAVANKDIEILLA